MSLRRMLSTATVAVFLVGTGLLAAPAAQAAPPASAAGAAHWVSYGPHQSYEHCERIGNHLVAIWLITEFRCDPYPPYHLNVWK
ncbi:hypothetical protein [Streptomyces uncialis]|nr:hypothetical protein [Streptomyces uncialis]MCX4657756.1 hypothetical protein [Streptomyces uncialis]